MLGFSIFGSLLTHKKVNQWLLALLISNASYFAAITSDVDSFNHRQQSSVETSVICGSNYRILHLL